MGNVLIVAAGGAVGASIRHLVGLLFLRLFGSGFPLGTLFINVTGSLVMGIFIEMLALKLQGSSALRLFVATGILGGYTTFSSFSLDFAVLWERGAVGAAALYLGVSVAGSIAAIFAGMWLVRSLAA